MREIAKFAVFVVIGAALGDAGMNPFNDWQWWAWFSAILISIRTRDWARGVA